LGQGWTFSVALHEEAKKLAATQPRATVGSIIASVFGDAPEFPDFVANIELEMPTLSLKFTEASDDSFALVVLCIVGGLSVLYAQCRRND
jgi:hypothetical protein